MNIAVIGANGAIGSALIEAISSSKKNSNIYALARTRPTDIADNIVYVPIDYDDENKIAEAAESIVGKLNLVLVTIGILHTKGIKPEKSLRDLDADTMSKVFAANTIAPALIAKHFIPKLSKDEVSVFAVLSARVGSISDNRLGGWYSYRASKAAANMIVKTAAIEVGRTNKQAIIVGLHPGTVDSALSKPYQANITCDKLFAPKYAADNLLAAIDTPQPSDSGKCFAWDGKEIQP